MSYKHISSEKVKNKQGKIRHIRKFSDSYGFYQEDNYENNFFTDKKEEKYREKMFNDGYVIRFEYLNLSNLSTRIQWIKCR
jgi:hypothetical protein